MNWRKANLIFGAALFMVSAGPSTGSAQTFQSYRCADGTKFIVGFFNHDSRAFVQVDGRSVTLGRGLALSGSRYSGEGVTLMISKKGTALRHARRPATACEPT